MKDRTQYIKLLKPIQRQLFFELMMKEAQFVLAIGGAISCLLLVCARFFIIPFLSYYFYTLLLLAVIIFLSKLWKNHPTLKRTAFVYNQFVPDDRVITSFSFLESEGAIASLQLSDTVKHMKQQHEKVLKRKKRLFYPKWLLMSLLFVSGALLLLYFPSEKLELAKQKENEIKLIAEEKEKLKEQIKAEKDPNVKKKLEEVQEKLATMKSAEEVLNELAKQSKELELAALKEKERQASFENWKEQIKNSGLATLKKMIDEKNVAAIEKELAMLNEKWNELSDEQKQAFGQLAQQQDRELTEEELAQVLEQIEKALESEEFLKQLAAAQAALQNAGLALQNQMTASGMPSSQIAFSPQAEGQEGNENSSTGGQQQGGNKSQGQQPGQNGQGANNGNNSSNGSGSGSGSGSGTGSGSGSGSGSGGLGAGKGQGSRELLTIPERLDGQTNIEIDNGSIGEGKPIEQSEGTGPILKGNIRPYSEVFSTYEKAYRQSTERYKYPADLEEIVKNYFTNIDPNKE